MACFFVFWVCIQYALVQNAIRVWPSHYCLHLESIWALWPAFFVFHVCIQCALVQNTIRVWPSHHCLHLDSISALWPAFLVFWVYIQCVLVQNAIRVWLSHHCLHLESILVVMHCALDRVSQCCEIWTDPWWSWIMRENKRGWHMFKCWVVRVKMIWEYEDWVGTVKELMKGCQVLVRPQGYQGPGVGPVGQRSEVIRFLAGCASRGDLASTYVLCLS